MINSTLYQNLATMQGGGVYVVYADDNHFNLRNSILIRNVATTFISPAHGIYVNNADAANVVNIQHNLLEGDAGGIVYVTSDAAGITEENTVHELEPALVFASLVAGDADYLRLVDGSPAVNAGNNNYLNNGTLGNPDDDITTDAAGEARIQRGIVDLGAYESNIKATQVIDFMLPRAGEVGEKINLVATTTAGLPVTFTSSNELVAAIGTGADAGKLVPLTVGMAIITVSQSGDDTYGAATLERTILVRDPTIYRVTTTGTGDGGSWTTATTLEGALGTAIAGDKIWIKAGIYKPHADDRSMAFSIPADVQVYGGFAGVEADDFDPATNDTRPHNVEGVLTRVTTLSGDLAGNDGTRPVRPPAGEDQATYNAALATYDATRTDNSNTVVKITGTYVTLNGLTITAGEGGTEWVDSRGRTFRFGGGLYALEGTMGMTVTACTFSNSNVDDDGGGAYFEESVTLTDCIFENNNANDDGVGAYFFGAATLTGCTFTNNMATTSTGADGGGAYFYRAPTLTDCIFENNNAIDDGGGAYFREGGTLTGCTFADNSATNDDGGGSYFSSRGTATLTSCTFNNNSTNDSGGGAYFSAASTLTGCTFTNNRSKFTPTPGVSAGGGGALFVETTTLTNCIFENNNANDDGAGAYFVLENNTLTGCTFTSNVAEDDGGGAYFAEVGATLMGCTFTNNRVKRHPWK